MTILVVVVLSFPFYYLSLDLPKYIVSDALQGRAFPSGADTARLFHIALDLPSWLGGPRVFFEGLQFERLSYLFMLSALFLLLVLINNVFKYVINMRKGALGERVLQRLRFDLFSTLLSFKPEAMHRLKPSEAATIIKDEVEPIGGFVGDAFVLPAFLGGQALTALAFILIQNLALGLIVMVMVLIQGAIIPRLRREQIRLGRQRQIVSRAFAGKIGEVVETISEVSNHGTAAVEKSLVAERLEALFGIRYQLYGRKFAVKALNNLLAQLTPFLFYAVGGYFALTGHLDLGQLVAVIAAYRDLPPPIKELIDWDQQRLDVEAKFHQVVEQFSLIEDPEEQEPRIHLHAAGSEIPTTGTIAAQALTVVSNTGDNLLDRLSLTLPLGGHIAMLGGAGEGAGCFAQILGGRITAFDGSLTIAGAPLADLPAGVRGRELAYAGPEPVVLEGTLRDNILYGLRLPGRNGEWTIDHPRAGAASPLELESRLADVLNTVGLAESVFRFGLARRLDPDEPTDLVARVAELRAGIRAKLAASGAEDAVEPYDPDRYTKNATIGENVLFGVPIDEALAGASLASHALTRRVLDRCGLTEPLIRMGRLIAATMLEIFSDLTPDHVLFEQFAFVAAEEFPEYREILARANTGTIDEEDRSRLLGLAMLYVEPRHRLGLLDADLQQRILAARHAFHDQATAAMADAIAFYDPQLYCSAAPLRDNLLFGLVAQGAAMAAERVTDAIRETLGEFELDREVYSWGLEQPAGYGGRLLFPAEKAQLALARCLIKQPSVLILNNALAAFSPAEAGALLARIKTAMAGRTLIVVAREVGLEHRFDVRVAFQGPKLAPMTDALAGSVGRTEPTVGTDAGPENEELTALGAVPIFANLDVPRLKLLAFTSERMNFAPGDVLFRQGDDSDAAYVLVSGSADVLIDAPDGPVVVSTVGANAIVGEMGIVTGDPRSATIIAKTPLGALRLRKEVFLSLLAEFPDMALSVTRLMVKRLQDNLTTVSRRSRDTH
ncbi:cyclic nucleotide-binding domain-containing protein [Starkeya sp. ORNL1]|uniref:cyclic nucleotide-binding domain-containing protein n=1 Tax=Starkeya sp. ORNL1 TaxID=2709380 RepID=UPI0014641040|nr:cyclic nucleotide-binding domain-containing protein [Starkeya sp. ORNL1]QJP12506.1 cyclic nucleotide-binding domain-containing protein [Starkeya sp. ORNL1]